MQRVALRSGLLNALKACWLGGSRQRIITEGCTRPLSQTSHGQGLLGIQQAHQNSSLEQHQPETASTKNFGDLVQHVLGFISGSSDPGMDNPCSHMKITHANTLKPENEDELADQKRLQRLRDEDREEHSKWQPILATEKSVDDATKEDESPYTSTQSMEHDEWEAHEDMEEFEEHEPQHEPEAEPFREQQQHMGYSTLQVFAADKNKVPQAASDRRYKEKASAEETEDKNEEDRAAPRNFRDPTDKLVRTDLQRHKEREYVGIYWTGKGVRYDSRQDSQADEDSGYMTGEGVPLPRPRPQPIPIVPEEKVPKK